MKNPLKADTKPTMDYSVATKAASASMKPVAQDTAPELARDVWDVIHHRRAVRRFSTVPVSREDIDRIIDAGRWAPSAINQQSWHFTVLTDKALIIRLSSQIKSASVKGIVKMGWKTLFHQIADFIHAPHDYDYMRDEDVIFHGAPVVVFLSAPRSNEWAALDIGMCAQNMMLTAQAMGINSCPIGLATYVEHAADVGVLHLPGGHHVHLALVFGYAAEIPMAKERKTDNVVFVEDDRYAATSVT